jgi:peptidoglycan/xylan/chitin deacetylase (PgdA/CDA1 family)
MLRREFITLVGATAATTAYGSVTLNAEPAADNNRKGNLVFLTSDDGPSAGTAAIIDIAERHRVPVALFMIGTNAIANEEHRRLLQRAHNSPWVTVGNHSDSHCLSHYERCYHDSKSVVSDFERASGNLGLVSRPTLARGPGRNVWRLPGLRLDDPAISKVEMGIEDSTDDALFVNGFHLFGWDVEWVHGSRGIPMQAPSAMIDDLTRPFHHSPRPGKIVMLMHDIMMRTANAAGDLEQIIEGVRSRGSRFGKLSEY